MSSERNNGMRRSLALNGSAKKRNHAPGDGANLSVKRRPEDLTPREREILHLIWEGHTNRSIAEHLKISIKTAEAHRSNMMKKLRVSNTAQLLKVALEGKIIQANDGAR